MRSSLLKASGLILLALLLAGCPKTREELRGGSAAQREMHRQTVAQTTPPPPPAPALSEEFDMQMREMRGRMEVLENEINRIQQKDQTAASGELQKVEELERKLKFYEEALLKMEGQIQALSVQVNQQAANNSSANKTTPAKKSTFDTAEELFSQKKWKEAILGYQKYRDNNPKGMYYSESTYKIGVAFQELGMKTEAKVFYEEVVEKFPKAEAAKKARYRLKNLK